MRPDAFTLVGGKSAGSPDPVFTPQFRVTPAMRQKVDHLAAWLAGGDARKIPRAKQAVMEMLCEAARTPPPLN